jgi:hypothetical protein
VLQVSEPKHLATVFKFALRDAGGAIFVDEVNIMSLCVTISMSGGSLAPTSGINLNLNRGQGNARGGGQYERTHS